MSDITTKQSVLLKGLSKKTVVAQFDQDHASADGGAVLLKACVNVLDQVLHSRPACRISGNQVKSGTPCKSCFNSACSA